MIVVKYRYLLLILALIFAIPICQANEHYVFNFGQNFGGEVLAINSYSKIQLGSGLNMSVGKIRYFETLPFSSLLSMGIKMNVSRFSDGAVIFKTYPINALEYYTGQNFMFGVGVTYHINPGYKYTCSNANNCGSSRNIKFDNGLGLIADYNYYVTAHSFLGLRYISMKYSGVRIENNSTKQIQSELDVSSFGIQYGYGF